MALGQVTVWGEPMAAFNNEFVPLHYAVHDASGKSLVLEWVGGTLSVYDDAAGVLTNSPPYDWQVLNLRNYVSLSPENSRPVKLAIPDRPAATSRSGLCSGTTGNKVYYYLTYEDMTLRALDLRKLDLSPGAPTRRIPIATIKPTVRTIEPESIPVATQ